MSNSKYLRSRRGRSLLVKDPAQRRLFFGMLLLGALIALVQVRNFFVYQSFEQGTCTILNGQVVENSGRDGTSHAPVFTYTVHTKTGQMVQASGYDGPTQSGFSQDEARQIFNDYAPGRSYTCWYDPADPTHAVLRSYGASVGGMILAYALMTLISWLILLFFGAPLYFVIPSIIKERLRGCVLILACFYCLLCLAALTGGAFVIAAIWNSV
jgi:ABC-type multidrug transport system fused ATPase/permease subunit